MLAVSIVSENFKTLSFSIAAADFMGTTFIPSPVQGEFGYFDEFEDRSSVGINETGMIAYSSPTSGNGSVSGSGQGTGRDNFNSSDPACANTSSYRFDFAGHSSFTDNQGMLTRSFGVRTLFEYARRTEGCDEGGATVYDRDLTGTFSTADFAVEASWEAPILGGTSTMHWDGRLVFDGDPIDIAPTSLQAIEDGVRVAFVVTGQPANAPTHTTPVAGIELFWATGPTSADIVGGALESPIPVYWNQAGGTADITALPTPPPEATHLLLVADQEGVLNENDETNNVLAAPLFASPTVDLIASPSVGKGDEYSVTLEVTNNALVPLDMTADWTQTIGVPVSTTDMQSVDLGTIQPGATSVTELGTFQHVWDWISYANPWDSENSFLADASSTLSALADSLSNSLASFDTSSRQQPLASRLPAATDLGGQLPAGWELFVDLPVQYDVEVSHQTMAVPAFDTVSDATEVTVEIDEIYTVLHTQFVAESAAAATSINYAARAADALSGSALAAGLAAEAAALIAVSDSLYLQAADPADPNFMELATAQPVASTELNGLERSFGQLYGKLELDYLALKQAEATSRNRALGAHQAGDAEWEARQLLAAAEFARDAAQLGARRLAYESLSSAAALDASTMSSATALPALTESLLGDLGQSDTQIGHAESNAQQVSAVDVNLKSGVERKLSGLTSSLTALAELEQAIDIRVNQLDQTTRDLTAAEASELNDLQAAIDAGLDNAIPTLSLQDDIHVLLDRAWMLALETNNWSALGPHANFAFQALVDFQQLPITTAAMSQLIADFEADGEIDAGVATTLTGFVNATQASLDNADFVDAHDQLDALLQSTKVNRDHGISNLAADQLRDFATYLNAMTARFLRHNPRNEFDVDKDGEVLPLDALLIVNELNRNGSSQLANPSFLDKSKLFCFDINEDGSVLPIDALRIINFLNSGDNGEGEFHRQADNVFASLDEDVEWF